MQKKNKLSLRLTDNQMLVLEELSQALNCSYSTLIRAMVMDFLTRNEDAIERIVTGQNEINDKNLF